MKYTNYYETTNEALSATGLVAPQVAYVKDASKVLYSGSIEDDEPIKIKMENNELVFKEEFKGLKFTSTGNSTIKLEKTLAYHCLDDLKYSLDDGDTWTQWDFSAISLSNGESVCFKGLNKYAAGSENDGDKFILTGSLAASGNIMSILDDNTNTKKTVPNYCFANLFKDQTSLTTAPELPATTLANYCYKQMFEGCSNLVTGPSILPATTLFYDCYNQMFRGCTSLVEAPELPATTLATHCYSLMFDGCTSLTTAPELPATTLANYCYYLMFKDCTNLNYIKCLATDISATSCTNNWVTNVSATGTFVKNASMSSWTTGVNGIPEGWTVQDA